MTNQGISFCVIFNITDVIMFLYACKIAWLPLFPQQKVNCYYYSHLMLVLLGNSITNSTFYKVLTLKQEVGGVSTRNISLINDKGYSNTLYKNTPLDLNYNIWIITNGYCFQGYSSCYGNQLHYLC